MDPNTQALNAGLAILNRPGTARDLAEFGLRVRAGERFIGAESVADGKSRWTIALRSGNEPAVQFVSPEGESRAMLETVMEQMRAHLDRRDV